MSSFLYRLGRVAAKRRRSVLAVWLVVFALVIHGHGPAGKSALLFTLAGRVRRIEGDLKILGHVLPQHIPTVRLSHSRRVSDGPRHRARRALSSKQLRLGSVLSPAT